MKKRKVDNVGIDMYLQRIPYEDGIKIIEDIQKLCPHVQVTIIDEYEVCDECEAVIRKETPMSPQIVLSPCPVWDGKLKGYPGR